MGCYPERLPLQAAAAATSMRKSKSRRSMERFTGQRRSLHGPESTQHSSSMQLAGSMERAGSIGDVNGRPVLSQLSLTRGLRDLGTIKSMEPFTRAAGEVLALQCAAVHSAAAPLTAMHCWSSLLTGITCTANSTKSRREPQH